MHRIQGYDSRSFAPSTDIVKQKQALLKLEIVGSYSLKTNPRNSKQYQKTNENIKFDEKSKHRQLIFLALF